jgi:sigma-E factor negative regulatory protein RseB
MLWLYWRHVRGFIAGVCAALAMAMALVVAAASLGGTARSVGTPQSARLPAARPPRRLPAPQPDAAAVQRGVALMNAAAVACRSISYHGVQMVAWSTTGGSDAYLIEVWHHSGEPELAQGDDDVDDHVPSADASNDAVIGVLSISSQMLGLLRTNYVIEYAGTGSSSDRPATIVAVWRHDGTLAARYWLDRITGLPLRREIFDPSGHLVNEGAFIDLKIGVNQVGLVPSVRARAWRTQPGTAGFAVLRRHGWTVPKTLAGNMTLVGITATASRSGQVLDASYSDGLSVVSVFMQRGELPDTLRGWHKARVNGKPVYLTETAGLGERGLAWSAGGYVYTVIADAPADTVADVVGQLPHDRADDGFALAAIWRRVGRGLARIGSWVNPFG